MQAKTETPNEITFPVAGMSCGSCARRIQTGLEAATGVHGVAVNLTAGEVTVSYDPRTTEPRALVEVIRKSGYKPGIPQAASLQ
ncbi:MAG: heavy-metal-associated domain-containing protein [Bryobacteraceae bacterium]|nr:heavy-metal-associated domain-containing protein [Bryobacteraceae bacterium]